MKVALIHDHLAQDGGAEKVLKVFAEMFPEAPIYTLLYEKENANKYYKNRLIYNSIIQKLPGGVKHYQWYLPLMPMAVEFFDLSEYDFVLSDSASFAKGVITRPEALHICYCHTPTRYLWSDTHQYIKELKFNKYFKKIISLVLNYIRLWDRQAADRVDIFIANSKTVQKRIEKYYRRDSVLIYPPVETGKFNLIKNQFDEELAKENYFLIGCRLAPYKRVDMVIEVFKRSGKKLKIFGSGVDKKRLAKFGEVHPHIEFLGRVSDEHLAALYRNCQAFIYPQEEDFGITAVEAMACGSPVIAYRKGGAVETIIEDKTGVFFNEQAPASLAEAIEKFDKKNFDPYVIRSWAEKFSVDGFKEKILRFIKEKCEKLKNNF